METNIIHGTKGQGTPRTISTAVPPTPLRPKSCPSIADPLPLLPLPLYDAMSAYRTTVRGKRSFTRRAKTTRYPKRRSFRRKTYKKRPRRGMSTRALLNKTSHKKRNGMLSWSNTKADGTSQPITAASSGYVNGNATGVFLFCPTAMDLTTPSTHTYPQEAGRTSRECYMKGFSEHLRLQTSSGIPWFHRRICFTSKGVSPFNTIAPSDTPVNNFTPYLETSNGLERLWFNEVINGMGNTLSAQYGILFKGQQNQDWNDLIVAPVDTSRVTLKFDKTWTLKSGNASGTIYERKLWHPMNKNLVYDDDETGVAEYSSHFSVNSKAGMGDYYIMDIFTAGLNATSTDQINVYANSTMYWHEK